MRELKIGTSWVRGVVGDALTPELIVNFACAFGTWSGGGPVVIGRDTRRSSPMLRAAVVSGLMAPGCEVIDLGVCSTPLVSFAVRELGASGGLSITGSHNDARWNALKFVGPDGALLNAVKSEELLDIYHASAFLRGSAVKPISAAPGIRDRYIEHILTTLDADPIRKRGFRIAIDFCNGSCAPIMSRLLAALDCELLTLNEEAASDFAHGPSPSVDNMRELSRFMRYAKADLGASINVDGDRIAFVAADGTALSEEYTLPIAAKSRLGRRAGLIVTNLSTSRLVEDVAARFGQQIIRASVGEGYVVDRAVEEDAVLAGEGNGGVGSLPATMTFDAALTLGMALEHFATTDDDPAAIARELPDYVMRKGAFPVPPDQVYRVIEEFRVTYSDGTLDTSDGLRVDWQDAWLHVRASNTEPLLRIIVEADSKERSDSLFESAMGLGRRAVMRRRAT